MSQSETVGNDRNLRPFIEYMGTKDYDPEQVHGEVPSLVLVDNQAPVAMSKNYKVSNY